MVRVSKKCCKPHVSGPEGKKQILDDVTSAHADEILEKLAEGDAKISRRIRKLALERLVKVDPDSIAEDVFCALDALEVEVLWKNSGRTRHGYVEPCELASEMFEEALEPYVDELRKCLKLSMGDAARLHCMGILKGIYKFKKEATTEFADWAEDDPHDSFQWVFDEWREGNKNPKNLEKMKEFMKEFFPEWYKDAWKR